MITKNSKLSLWRSGPTPGKNSASKALFINLACISGNCKRIVFRRAGVVYSVSEHARCAEDLLRGAFKDAELVGVYNRTASIFQIADDLDA